MKWTNRALCGGLAAAWIAGTGSASAEPDVDAIAESTCTYPQVIAALNAQSPAAAAELSTSPLADAWLQQLIASPPDQRRELIAQAQAFPAAQPYTGLFPQIARTCSNY